MEKIERFEIWLRKVCFQKPTPEAYDLARDAWIEALKGKEAPLSSLSSDGLCPEDIKIMLAQKEIKELGYQWQEQIYNDGVPECSVDFAKGTDPCTFMDGKDDFGWGRYSRAYCWEQALARIREIEGV